MAHVWVLNTFQRDDAYCEHDSNVDGFTPAIEKQADYQQHQIAPTQRHYKI